MLVYVYVATASGLIDAHVLLLTTAWLCQMGVSHQEGHLQQRQTKYANFARCLEADELVQLNILRRDADCALGWKGAYKC